MPYKVVKSKVKAGRYQIKSGTKLYKTAYKSKQNAEKKIKVMEAFKKRYVKK